MNLDWHGLALALGWKSELPTVDYYVLAGLGHLVGRPFKPGRITRRGPHTFDADGRLIIVRYANRDELSLLADRQWQSVHYVIDDMLPIAAACTELPDAYRQRLGQFAAEVLPRILDASPEIVAPRQETLGLFPGRPSALLDPAYLHVAADHTHFDRRGPEPASGPAPLRAAFLGTRSHGAGLDFLTTLADAARRAGLPIRLTVFLGPHIPAALRDNPLIENRKPLAWAAFRRMMQRERFHVLLAPLPDTPFNKGRSITKLLDAAAVGAAGLYSNRLPFSDRVSHGTDGLLIEDDIDAWMSALRMVADDRALARRIAEGSAALARRLGDPGRQTAFWLPRLGLDQPRRSS